MDDTYILSIDQSTQGTKALLFNQEGILIERSDLPHEQLVNEQGWVSHDLMEIYRNTIQVVKNVIKNANISKNAIVGIGISNQRETAAVWDRNTGEPLTTAIVWQCSRAKEICGKIEQAGYAEKIRMTTGINLSPYFPASKFAWFLENVKGAREKAQNGSLCLGTIDSWLIYKLTKGKVFKTDYSNASRTQLFHIKELQWDEEICKLFHVPVQCLAKVCDSNSKFGETDFDGYLEKPIPIHGVLGDSHGALFGQGCLKKGMIKTTYGTGSSIMMNIGETPVYSNAGVVTSLAWGMDGRVTYVLEGNINYTGAVISWLQKDLQLVSSAKETELLAKEANPKDGTYLVPAFTGLGAPYWDSEAKGAIIGITRTTKKKEIIRAGLDSIAYQITDIVNVMKQDSGLIMEELRVDGGPTRNTYLMQFQSDMLDIPVLIPEEEELSGIGAAYVTGLALHIYDYSVFKHMNRKEFKPIMNERLREEKYKGWKNAVGAVLSK
ncbi:MAG: glycerol kinase [Lachnospiraceae bacterium]